MIARRITWAVALSTASAAILVADYLWRLDLLVFVVLVALSVLGYAEFAAMLRRIDVHIPVALGAAACVPILATTHWIARGVTHAPDLLMLILLAAALAFLALTSMEKAMSSLAGPALALFGLVYIPLPLGSLFSLRTLPGGPARMGVALMAAAIAVIKLSDVGAYCVGRPFGKRPLAPAVSPNKTVEGFLGQIAAGVAVSAGLFSLAFDVLPLWASLLAGAVISVAACAGDLVESKIKRTCDTKDSSAHGLATGGILDVLDSLLIGAPVAYWIMVLFDRLGVLRPGIFGQVG